MFERNGKFYVFSVTNFADLKRYFSATGKLAQAEKENSEEFSKNNDLIRYTEEICKMITDFFAEVLGKEAAAEICEGGLDSAVCERAFYSFCEYVAASTTAAAQERIQLKEKMKRYRPVSAKPPRS